MFLFKLTLPILGTATLGAVGTGIYYGVDSWRKNGGEKGKKSREEVATEGQTQEADPQKPDSSTVETEALPLSQQEIPPRSEPQPPSLPSVEVVVEETDE